MTKEDKIKKLKKERTRLYHRIREWKNKEKDATKLAQEYEKLTNELIQLGLKVTIQADYLKPEYYKKYKKSKTNTKQKSITKKESTRKLEKNIYILSLAWTDSKDTIHDNSFRYTIEKVAEYLHTLGLKKTEETFNEKEDNIEKIIRFEFEGNDQSFQIVKLGAIYFLDTLSHNDYEKINISIFGKKRLF